MCIWLSKFKASAPCPALHNKVTLSPVDRGDHNAGQEQQALDAPTLLALRPQERLRFCPQKPQQLSLQHWKRSWAHTSTAVVPEVFQLKGASANPAVGHWQQSFCHKLQLHEMIWVFFVIWPSIHDAECEQLQMEVRHREMQTLEATGGLGCWQQRAENEMH